ncbi:sodium/glutamate symporter [Pseudoduganella sp. RAF19]|uniref:sodium/glutamate symporter n=1 Tax=Pseudoduganella sp. RAF19 TaxID=3233052 RepID=UPI003F9C16EA
MTLSAWYLLALAVPVLLLGEAVLRRVQVLARFNIPVPVVGGLLFSLVLLALRVAGMPLTFAGKVDAGWWTWLVTVEPEWATRPLKNLNLPLLIGFFTCVGLAAPLRLLRTGGRMLLVLLVATTVLSVLQNTVGVAVAVALGAPALLGVACGSLTLVGGHGTALGFAPRFEQAGLAAAATIGASAATFGLVAGALLSGPLGAWLLRKHTSLPASAERGARASSAEVQADAIGATRAPVVVASFFADVGAVAALGWSALGHALLIAVCVKAGAWASYGLDKLGATLPAYMGALLVGFAIRAMHDACGATWLKSEVITKIAAVLLSLFLAVTLAALNLQELAQVAGPMLAILTVNTIVTLAFAAAIVYPILGRNYEAAVATAGLTGYGIGSTATAVAAMDAITRQRGPAPQATTIVPPTGGFLIDLTNAPVIAAFLRI